VLQPEALPEAESVPLTEELTVLVSEALAHRVAEAEVQPDAEAEAVAHSDGEGVTVEQGLCDSVALVEEDKVGDCVALLQGVGVRGALAHKEMEADAVLHPDELMEGEPVVEPLEEREMEVVTA
jgi:hypothetical protein